ncbi:aminotransferase class III-fold pyridoxal phosphate-dependent enzyme [Neolewinella xylanilytica]|nr:aminotransferase class III-fold pyridoxal phosphate-dependent enzyme [Neolewinella xylanilytica]
MARLYAALSELSIPESEIDSLASLPGEVDRNYFLRTAAGAEYLVKIRHPDHFDQAPVLSHLSGKSLPFSVPIVVGSIEVPWLGVDYWLHLYRWVPGRLLSERNPITDTILRAWGEQVGRLHRALSDLDYPAVRRVYKWDPLRVESCHDRLVHLDPDQRRLAEYFLSRLNRLDWEALPRSVCYNDAHEHNLIVNDGGRVTGIIDFGDTVHTVSVSEVAVACAYAGMQQPDPLGAMRRLVEGYHSASPLSEAEVEVLYDLIAARLLLTVTIAAENRPLQPDNPYLSVSEAPAWDLLNRWRTLPPRLARATFRLAAGFSAHATRDAYDRWVTTAACHPVLGRLGKILPLDLSVGSTQLGGNANFWELPRFVTLLRRLLEDSGAEVAVGGYGEVRPVYTTDAFQGLGNAGPRWRSVHLGLDFWTATANETVFAPLDGEIYATGIDPTPGGYGGTVLIAHTPLPGLTFYTLYGHLAYESLQHWGAGARVQAGQPIAKLGGTDGNGGWPPHLHFQVLLDLLDMGVDYPGVAYPEERDVWLGLCPDPRTLQPGSLPAEASVMYPVPTLLDARKRRLGYGLSVSYRQPLQMLRGYRQYLYDDTGRRFLDTVNNVAHVGHEHPAVVEAARRQLAVLNTNTRYLHPAVLEFAEALVATLPEGLSVVHVVNSGSEANDLALRMAEAVTGNRQVAAMEMGYHGNTSRSVEVSSYKFGRPGGKGRPKHTFIYDLPGPDFRELTALPPGTWSFIGETILSCAGQIVLPPGFLPRLYRAIRATGGICIADEVQTGVGRTGAHWWAFESQGVLPDIVTIGKPIGNGHPIGAVVCTPRVAEAFANGMEYFNTFGGNPVSAAVGMSVLDTVKREGLRENAAQTGNYLVGMLDELRHRHPVITDVRGQGLFLGVELRDSRGHPDGPRAAYLKQRMRELGFLMSTDGPDDNVLKIKPPMCFTRDNAELLCAYLDRVCREDAMRPTSGPLAGQSG